MRVGVLPVGLGAKKYSSETVYAITGLPAEQAGDGVDRRLGPRDLIRSALKLTGYDNTTAGRRARTERRRVIALYGIT